MWLFSKCPRIHALRSDHQLHAGQDGNIGQVIIWNRQRSISLTWLLVEVVPSCSPGLYVAHGHLKGDEADQELPDWLDGTSAIFHHRTLPRGPQSSNPSIGEHGSPASSNDGQALEQPYHRKPRRMTSNGEYLVLARLAPLALCLHTGCSSHRTGRALFPNRLHATITASQILRLTTDTLSDVRSCSDARWYTLPV
jgi:hypothetical protein